MSEESKEFPVEGCLLSGPKRISGQGVEQWFDFPRYRVVGFHMNKEIMFAEVLNRYGEVKSIQSIDIFSDQWKEWNTRQITAADVPEYVKREIQAEALEAAANKYAKCVPYNWRQHILNESSKLRENKQ